MSIRKPMKGPSESITNDELQALIDEYGYVWGSAKLDGFRVTCDNKAYTSSMKPIKNKYVQEILSQPEYVGLDGEVVVGNPESPNAFSNTKGAVTRAAGEPDFKLYVFDTFLNKNEPYEERCAALSKRCKVLLHAIHIKQVKIKSIAAFIEFENDCVKRGCEGAMVRPPGKPYKEGRATLKSPIIFKRKPLEDREAIIIGWEEQMKNNNVKTKDAMGNSVRSSHKANKVGKGTMGAIILEDSHWKNTFKLSGGKGIDEKFRQWLWDNRVKLTGSVLTYTFQRHGSIDAPRQPKYKAFRDPEDITDY